MLTAFLKRVLIGGGKLAVANKWAMLYSVGCILVFALAYHFMGIAKHFTVPDYLKGKENTFMNSLYTSVMAQNNAMPDNAPKTTLARVLFMLQVTLGWIWVLHVSPRVGLA
jgi:hypothetical protein